MLNFTNREALYNAYLNTDQKDWEHTLGSFATEGVDVGNKLYYMSLDSSLEGSYTLTESFEDKLARNGGCDHQTIFTIPLPPRLLTSPDVQGCWNQIFNRVKHCFAYETDTDKNIDVYLYEVDITDCVVLDTRALISNWLVHDAYINSTHAVFGHPVLKPVKKLTIKNTLNYPDENCTYYYPFNDGKYLQCLLSTPLVVLEENL